MAVDPFVSLASSLHAGPRTFALLLGSGVSVSAGVPSGWNLTLDLVRRLAIAQGDDAGDDPVSWYRAHAHGDPDYSGLLTELAPSPADRRNLLERYFEPTEEERAEGSKVPTKAHRAIAYLVAQGFVKVIVTTNFDRLLEIALAEASVQAHIVSSPAHAAGAMPIAHSRCTIIKVHGDYLSPDLKNTVDELAGYDAATDHLLDEVFDQYGLIVCGWSGVWDAALRNAILRSPGRRFATYWLHRGPIAAEAEEIVTHRDAISMLIQDADHAFDAVVTKVEALAEAIDRRPEDTALAVAQLKRYLPDPIHRIKLHDLVVGETNAAIGRIEALPMDGNFKESDYAQRMADYEHATAGLLKLLATGAFFSDRIEHDQLWIRCVERLASRALERGGKTLWLAMQQYPTLLALYAIGFGAAAADRIESIARVLGTIKVQEDSGSLPVGAAVSSGEVLSRDIVKRAIDELKDRKTPISDHLLDVLRPAVSDLVPDEDQLQDFFDEVEYLAGLACAVHYDGAGPLGRAVWRSWRRDRSPGTLVVRHAKALVESGLFDDQDQLAATRDAYDKSLKSSQFRF